MRCLIGALALTLSTAALADAPKNGSPKPLLTAEQKAGHELIRRKLKEMIVLPNSQAGKFFVVNAQKHVPDGMIGDAIALAKQDFEYAFVVTNAPAVTAENAFAEKQALKANAVIFLVNSDALPPILVAPEQAWAILNTRALVIDGTSGKKLAKRFNGEFLRAFVMTLGGFGSMFQNNLMNCVTLDEVDVQPKFFIPVDYRQKIARFQPYIGLRPAQKMRYEDACAEGIAPAPTNEIQKLIWDEVHAIPTKPIKIEYNEKRDKGK